MQAPFFIIRVICLCLACCTYHSAWARDMIRIGWVNAMANTPLLIADQKGYFREVGLDARIQRFDSGPLVRRALQAGDLDLAYIGMPPVYHANADGANIKVIAKVNYGQAALITRIDSPLQQLSDLKGKRIAGVRRDSGMDVLLRAFILTDQAGLDPDRDVKIIHMHTDMMDASVDRGVVDAAFTWEPFVSQAVLTQHARILLDVNQVFPHYPWYVIVAPEHSRKQKRVLLLKALKAHMRAVDFLNSDEDAGSDIIIKTFGLDRVISSLGHAFPAHEVVREARQRLGWQYDFASGDRKFLQRLMDYSYELGIINKKLNVNEIIDRSFLEQAKKLEVKTQK